MINPYFVLLAFICIIIPIMTVVGVFDASIMYNQVAFGYENVHIQNVQAYCDPNDTPNDYTQCYSSELRSLLTIV